MIWPQKSACSQLPARPDWLTIASVWWMLPQWRSQCCGTSSLQRRNVSSMWILGPFPMSMSTTYGDGAHYVPRVCAKVGHACRISDLMLTKHMKQKYHNEQFGQCTG
eukprot:3143971-Amphidinium_carterae.2